MQVPAQVEQLKAALMQQLLPAGATCANPDLLDLQPGDAEKFEFIQRMVVSHAQQDWGWA